MRICVIGAGYVGLVSGACFAGFGVDVVCADVDEAKVELLCRGEIPIYEPGLSEVVLKNVKEGRLTFSTDVAGSIRDALVVFIAVGTPEDGDGSADLSFVKAAAKTIAQNLNGYKLIVTKSTVPVGTGKMIEQIISDEMQGVHSFDVASNPEFLREGSAVGDFMRPNRIVIGARSEKAVDILKDLYSPVYLRDTPFVVTDVETAELIKYASNAFLATKITFINEIANICEKVGADVHTVARAMGLDNRIGPKFLHPGPGYGGSCFPKDTVALLGIASKFDYDFKVLRAVVDVNNAQRGRMVEKIEAAVGPLKDTTIAVAGLTFKPNTDDVRESPAVDIIRILINDKGAKVKAYDPAGMENARKILPTQGVTYSNNVYEACEGSDALVIATEWNQFRKLDMERVKESLNRPVILDLRNVYCPEEMEKLGFEYISVGR